ncbi:unnamed protein product [Kuraishia capsulata CBS 1993]|uniref:Translation initiation factor eIF2 assembly protein n=1 Tax=Kuraishia capsulata CBS 1993 TaxID=1382522 RepID=W6MTF7_9ASCO|nr:uncharacterized protein KUCA_T00000992001 [Kuraishia capsulata CBS 1993]CDK25025.1 unnamed protein product [Kuraishia capsulata CBS 1993]
MPSSTEDYTVLSNVVVTSQDVLNCCYSSWYPTFKDLTVSEAKIIRPLPAGFLNYLNEDDIRLPKVRPCERTPFSEVRPTSDNEYSDWSDDEDSSNAYQDPSEAFKDVHKTIISTISEFGGVVTPKLNWSAPQDATWMMVDNSTRCRSANDVYLLLKSSDYINHDLGYAFDIVTEESAQDEVKGLEFELVLKKWFDFNPAMEFRCFVKDRQLLAISQRDLNYYDFLEDLKDKIIDKIGACFDDSLLPKFESNSFTFDVYLDRDLRKVYLVDFNPFARTTSSYLFSWNELITGKFDAADPEIRLVTQHNSGRFACKEHSQNHVPKDVVDASMDSAAMVELAKEWERALRQKSDLADNSEEK